MITLVKIMTIALNFCRYSHNMPLMLYLTVLIMLVTIMPS